MTGESTGPDDVIGRTDRGTELIHDSLATELTAAEWQSLARSRKVAFFVLATCAVLASCRRRLLLVPVVSDRQDVH